MFAAIMATVSLVIDVSAQQSALFEPPKDRQLLVIGQDMGAIGGFPKPNNDGYVDHIDIKPGGVTTYTGLTKLGGLKTLVNLYSGDTWAQAIIDNPIYANSVLVIGLHMVDQEKSAANGELDAQIKMLGEWIKQTKRPVFLRIGYEFDGTWNHYDPESYKAAYKRLVTKFRELQVTNCVTVWQASTSPVNGKQADIGKWYPGDEYVDWIGYSWFLSSANQIKLTDGLLAFAREHKKPVMVCESAPQGYDNARLTQRNIYKGIDPKEKTPEKIWKEWYAPFFNYIEKNKDVIRIVAYINVNWDSQMLWGWPYLHGYWGDSRVEVNPDIKKLWLETISDKKWMNSSPTLFQDLGFPAQSDRGT